MTYVLISQHFDYRPWVSLSVKPNGAYGERDVFDDVGENWRWASRNAKARANNNRWSGGDDKPTDRCWYGGLSLG